MEKFKIRHNNKTIGYYTQDSVHFCYYDLNNNLIGRTSGENRLDLAIEKILESHQNKLTRLRYGIRG